MMSFVFSRRMLRGFSATAFALAVAAPAWSIDPPCVPNAMPETRSLLAYMESIHGTHILSGQQETVDWFGDDQEGMFDYIFANTGKYPAVRGFDFLFMSDPRNDRQRIGERAIEWARSGGIVTISFHWFVDTGTVGGNGGGAFYRQGVTSDGYTTFQMLRALTEGTPENAEFVAEMDLIAGQLKMMRDAGVPVIWRPFHEAGGTWFWWSGAGTAADAEAFKQGWRFMWDRFTHVHGLTNLVWEFNPNNLNILTNWYPGDAYVDMISLDVYPNAGHPVFATEYNQYKDFTQGRKLVALSENGRIPDPDQLAAQNAHWVYFCTWDGEFITSDIHNDAAFKHMVYNHPRVLTRDELPKIYLWGRPPEFSTHPVSQNVEAGADVTLGAEADANEPFTYQWRRDGVPIAGATNSSLPMAGLQPADSGIYTVEAASSLGVARSRPSSLVVGARVGRLVNLSTRGPVRTGDEIMIAGFVVGGSTPRTVLIRGVGPGLVDLGVPDVLDDPRIALFSGPARILDNDNWGAQAIDAPDVAAAVAKVGAFPLAADSLDAALVATLVPGHYTVHVTGAGASEGIALAEIYDVSGEGATSRLLNISTRGYLSTGASIMIPGIVVGEAGRALLVRGVGPGLAGSGLSPLLPDPVIRVVDREGNTIFSNDNWGGETTVAAAVAATGAFPLPDDSLDAAMVVTLPPGHFTVLVSGKDGGSGIALVEVYEMAP